MMLSIILGGIMVSIKRGSFLFFILFLNCMNCFSIAQEIEYIVYMDEIIKKFSTEMEHKYGLICVGEGGRMSRQVETIRVMFHLYRRATIEEARALEILSIERLREMINSDEKIRSNLYEFPFPTNRIGVSISFYSSCEAPFADGSVSSVDHSQGKLFYESQDSFTESYAQILEEPYLEAKRTVESSSNINPFVHQSKSHEPLIDAIFAAYQREMWDDYELEIERIGGKLVNGVEEIGIRLIHFHPTHIEKARELQVIATERMLYLINNNKQLRPYVNDFPLTIDKLKVVVLFRKKNYCPYFDGSLESASRPGNEIIYFIGQKREPIEKTQIIRAKQPMFGKESYQEALSKVEGSRAFKKMKAKCSSL